MARSTTKMTLARCESGAVYVELLVAFLPVFVFFLAMMQLALLFADRLLVDHAAVQAARAAAVVFGDEAPPYGDRAGDPNTLSAARRHLVRDAVLVSLAPLILDGSLDAVEVTFPAEDAPGGPDQPEDQPLVPMGSDGPRMMRVHVEATVVCKIAIANLFACHRGGPAHRLARISSESIFPYQGASYGYE